MRPKGWVRESYRHYLAAKGISTRRYNAVRRYNAPDFKAASEKLKSFVSDRVEAPDEKKLMTERTIAKWRSEYQAKLDEREENGEISSQNADRFMAEEFDRIVQEYLKNIITREEARIALERRFEIFTKVNGKKLKLFDFSGGGKYHGI